MLVSSTRDILRAFSDGHLGWREAARRLNLERYEQLDALRKQYRLPLYQPDEDERRALMDESDEALYGDWS